MIESLKRLETVEQRAAFLARLVQVGGPTQALKETGSSNYYAYQLRKTDPGFAKAWNDALLVSRSMKTPSAFLVALSETGDSLKAAQRLDMSHEPFDALRASDKAFAQEWEVAMQVFQARAAKTEPDMPPPGSTYFAVEPPAPASQEAPVQHRHKHNQHDGQPYNVVKHDFGHGLIPCFELVCGKCRKRAFIGNRKNLELRPDVVLRKFRQMAWAPHSRRAAGNRCPSCAFGAARDSGPQEAQFDDTIENEGVSLTNGHDPQAAVAFREFTPFPGQVPPPPAPEPEPAMAINPSPPILAAARDLTAAQSVKATRLLDEHFDIATGKFEAGWNDQKIGVELAVPFASVAKFREEGGWGKVRQFEDIEQLRADLSALRGMLGELDRRVSAAEKNRLG